MSRINDIWRKLNGQSLNHELGFYTYETFDCIPSMPGFYAWFYPLRVHTKDLEEFIRSVNIILDYDATCLGNPTKTGQINFNWDNLILKASIESRHFNINSFSSIWDEYCKSDEKFKILKETLYRASFILPPLYVGKASDLHSRCSQHLRGTGDKNDFHNRYQEFAEIHKIPSKKVADLLFVCIKSGEKKEESEKSEELYEAILKIFTKPKYSVL